MWLLKKISSDENVLHLISEKSCYVVGRKHGDLILVTDSSISRKHCTIKVAKKDRCPFPVKTATGVWVEDEGSKYGTFIQNDNQWIKLEANQAKNLTQGSVIRFGIGENVWRLEYKPLIACTSGIMSDQKQKIKDILASIDGELANNWVKQCSMVLVNQVTLTIKVVLALINGIPIVKASYVEKVAECVKSNMKWPEYENYKPDIGETTLEKDKVSLDIKMNRKELFNGKRFIIQTHNQLNVLKDVIIAAGGSAEVIDFSNYIEWLGNDNVIVVQCPVDVAATNPKFKEISDKLRLQYHKRLVPDSEIAQAIAYSSLEKYCNPNYKNFGVRLSAPTVSMGDVIVEDTPIDLIGESQLSEIRNTSAIDRVPLMVSESISSLTPGMKRGHSPEPASISKKAATDHLNIMISETASSTEFSYNGKSNRSHEPVNVLLKPKEVPEGVPPDLPLQNSKKNGQTEKPKSLQEKTVAECLPSTSKDIARPTAAKVVAQPRARVSRYKPNNMDDEEIDSFWSLNPQPTKRKPTENVTSEMDCDKQKEKKRRLGESCHVEEPKPKGALDQAEVPKISGRSSDVDTKKLNSGGGGGGEPTTKKTEITKAVLENDLSGYICVTRKAKKETDLLDCTIIMQSLVALPKDRRDDPAQGPRNVKTFKKQKILTGRQVELEPIPRRQILDEDWSWIDTRRNITSQIFLKH